jgi:hypothetical protein
MLGADASVLRKDGRGQIIVEPDALICCTGFGGSDRNSDPTIGGAVNALARFGAMITLRNPVGLYMDHIDLAGWATPDGRDVRQCLKVVRGTIDMIERLVVEVPDDWGYLVGDLTIAGVPIRYGGQIAECITVKLTGVAAPVGITNEPSPCTRRCCIDPNYPTLLRRAVPLTRRCPAGRQTAFSEEGELGLEQNVAIAAQREAKRGHKPTR